MTELHRLSAEVAFAKKFEINKGREWNTATLKIETRRTIRDFVGMFCLSSRAQEKVLLCITSDE